MLNIGSITKIEIAQAEDITLGAVNTKNEVTVANTGSWDEPAFTTETAGWNEGSKHTAAGDLFAASLRFQLPKQMPDNHQAAHKYKNIPLVIRITDGNGNKVLIGEPSNPVYLEVSKKIPANTAGINAYQMEAKHESQHPAYFSA